MCSSWSVVTCHCCDDRAWGPDVQKTAEVPAVAVHGVTGCLLGPCTQVHGQVVPPPSGRGRGGGDAGSSLPGVLPPNLVHSTHAPGQTRRVVNHLYHTHHLSCLSQECPCLRHFLRMDLSEQPVSGAAQRRRQRRLRSYAWRQSPEAWSRTADHSGFSAVAVHRWSSTSLSIRRGSSSWSRLFSRPQGFHCRTYLVVDVPVFRSSSSSLLSV